MRYLVQREVQLRCPGVCSASVVSMLTRQSQSGEGPCVAAQRLVVTGPYGTPRWFGRGQQLETLVQQNHVRAVRCVWLDAFRSAGAPEAYTG